MLKKSLLLGGQEWQNQGSFCCEYAQRGKGRRKLYQLHRHSLLRIRCHMMIDSLYLVDDRYLFNLLI
jgi:hypothetical protein